MPMTSVVDTQTHKVTWSPAPIALLIMAVVTEVASIPLTVQAFRWAFAPLGTFQEIVGGLIWPLALHAAAIAAVLIRPRAQELLRLTRLFRAVVVLLVVFSGLGMWSQHGGDPVAIAIAAAVAGGGPILVRVAVNTLRSPAAAE
ncbi:hypothetical protein [Amycolatopsis roodepoortensis]|uniref:Uncharacterized protein n=2 Tax=Amycolatopsis roodepoortensis TaxID=700274 RepID=A0ABR9LI96_9PSEU|nr:hypothetical protein [Amycolatopsis roodepoortensis]MBE1580409.1 hypothetical protein [Amycolatopsis roodepoortensis]